MSKEIEIRYRLNPSQKKQILSTLKTFAWKPKEIDQQDSYFCSKEYVLAKKTRECPYVLRIRTTDAKSELAFKSFQGGDGSSWIELETVVGDPSAMWSILEHLKQSHYLQINKTRLSGIIEGVEVNIDEIENLGNFVELEVLADQEDVSSARIHLSKIASKIGLMDDNIITTGYVQLMEEKLEAAY